jgi:hypothetical protein
MTPKTSTIVSVVQILAPVTEERSPLVPDLKDLIVRSVLETDRMPLVRAHQLLDMYLSDKLNLRCGIAAFEAFFLVNHESISNVVSQMRKRLAAASATEKRTIYLILFVGLLRAATHLDALDVIDVLPKIDNDQDPLGTLLGDHLLTVDVVDRVDQWLSSYYSTSLASYLSPLLPKEQRHLRAYWLTKSLRERTTGRTISENDSATRLTCELVQRISLTFDVNDQIDMLAEKTESYQRRPSGGL